MLRFKVIATGSGGNAFWLDNGLSPLLLECGVPIRKIRKGTDFQLFRAEACLITHEHKDHSLSVKEIGRMGIPVYLTEGTAEALDVSGHPYRILEREGDGYRKIRLKNHTILPLKTYHDAKEPVGFWIKDEKIHRNIAFFTDTASIPYALPRTHYLIVECNFVEERLDENVMDDAIHVNLRNRIVNSHLSLERLLKFIERLKEPEALLETHVIHLSDQNSEEDLIRRALEEATKRPVYIH